MVYKLSQQAEQDIEAIYDYSLQQFGLKQAQRYIADFHTTFTVLSEQPKMGQSVYGLFRYRCGRHMIFYRPRQHGVLVIRVLHERMLPERHLKPPFS